MPPRTQSTDGARSIHRFRVLGAVLDAPEATLAGALVRTIATGSRIRTGDFSPDPPTILSLITVAYPPKVPSCKGKWWLPHLPPPLQKGTISMRLSCHSLYRFEVTFSDEHLVANAGLMLPATLSQHLRFRELFDEHVDLGDAPGPCQCRTQGDDPHPLCSCRRRLDRRRRCSASRRHPSGARPRRACAVDAPYVLAQLHLGHARQLDVVASELLTRAWAAGAGPRYALVHHRCRLFHPRDLRLGQTRRDPLHLQLRPRLQPSVRRGCSDRRHPARRLRGGNAHSGRGAASFLSETFRRVRTAGASGPLVLRADSGFYHRNVVDACHQANVSFCITAKLHKACAKRPSTPSTSPLGSTSPTSSTAPTLPRPPISLSAPKASPVVSSCAGAAHPRQPALLVHRVLLSRLHHRPRRRDARARSRSPPPCRDREHHPRSQIRVCLNHLPSGRFRANAAWLAFNVIAHNLARFCTRIGLSDTLITTETLRRRYLSLPGRLTRSARRVTLHLPTR